jgi:radical SAM superfamily enzyme YgiQ (UPF0313 family)
MPVTLFGSATRIHQAGGGVVAPAGSLRVLIVDLNNFASFPTLAVGILTAAMRKHGHSVRVLCPLAFDVPASLREHRETLIDHGLRRLHLSDWVPFLGLRDMLRRLETTRVERPNPVVLREVARALDDAPDAILISAYLQHFNSVAGIAALARDRGIPVILGGPMFNLPEVAESWRRLPGISAVVGAEIDRDLPALVEAVCKGKDALAFPGVVLPDGRRSAMAAPLRDLDDSPLPDFTDFPWDRYPVRIIPLMTGRGCQWDKCLFCSDVISTSGRSFRSRSVGNVLAEMEEQVLRHETRNFLFLDLKLNSWPGMIRGIAVGTRERLPGAEWVGTVHVDERRDNGLSRADLDMAVAGGMRRISFGLETGSQRLLDAMRKGSSVARNSAFIRDAHAAGLSIRCTMFKGFPGETADDMRATADFLEEHAHLLDRVRFNEFTLHSGTPIWNEVARPAGDSSDGLTVTEPDDRRARTAYRRAKPRGVDYRREKARALQAVFGINRKILRDTARQFDGLM